MMRGNALRGAPRTWDTLRTHERRIAYRTTALGVQPQINEARHPEPYRVKDRERYRATWTYTVDMMVRRHEGKIVRKETLRFGVIVLAAALLVCSQLAEARYRTWHVTGSATDSASMGLGLEVHMLQGEMEGD